MSTVWRFDPDQVVPEFDPIMAWLRFNGIVPENVPLDATVVFNDDDTMTVDVWLVNDNGRRYALPDTGKPARGVQTVPLLASPPPLKSLIAVPADPDGPGLTDRRSDMTTTDQPQPTDVRRAEDRAWHQLWLMRDWDHIIAALDAEQQALAFAAVERELRRIHRQADPTTTTEHDEGHCHRCLGPNPVWSAPSPLWNAVMRGGSIANTDQHDGIVCPMCFAELAEAAGIARLWRFSAERVLVELETITPSGRIWDAEAWLWRDPAEELSRP